MISPWIDKAVSYLMCQHSTRLNNRIDRDKVNPHHPFLSFSFPLPHTLLPSPSLSLSHCLSDSLIIICFWVFVHLFSFSLSSSQVNWGLVLMASATVQPSNNAVLLSPPPPFPTPTLPFSALNTDKFGICGFWWRLRDQK